MVLVILQMLYLIEKKEEYIYNDLLKENIYFEKSELSDGKFEYSANIVKGDTYYQISGIIPKKRVLKKNCCKNLFLENY